MRSTKHDVQNQSLDCCKVGVAENDFQLLLKIGCVGDCRNVLLFEVVEADSAPFDRQKPIGEAWVTDLTLQHVE